MLKTRKKAQSSLDARPPAYARLSRALGEGREAKEFEIAAGRQHELPRFAARYRLAAVCEGMRLPGYSVRTTLGYSALLRIHLCYSAIEQYGLLFDIEAAALLTGPRAEEVLSKLCRSDADRATLKVITARLTKPRLRGRTDLKLHEVLEALRHTFVHGALSPGATDSDGKGAFTVIARAGKYGCPYLLNVLASDLESRVNRVLGPESPAV